jgi:hypothetical protein
MKSRYPQNDSRYEWTHHAVEKMRHYGLSEGRVRRVIHSPKRVEEGIAPGTIAAMQASTGSKKPYEIWVMYQVLKHKTRIMKQTKALRMLQASGFMLQGKKRIITAWRYPGVSKPRAALPVPDDILSELMESPPHKMKVYKGAIDVSNPRDWQ